MTPHEILGGEDYQKGRLLLLSELFARTLLDLAEVLRPRDWNSLAQKARGCHTFRSRGELPDMVLRSLVGTQSEDTRPSCRGQEKLQIDSLSPFACFVVLDHIALYWEYQEEYGEEPREDWPSLSWRMHWCPILRP